MVKTIIGILLICAIAITASGLFIINEGEQAIITRFGKPVGGVKFAGLHLKIPFIEEVHKFEKRILKWDGDPNQITTQEKKFIWVDTTARWRIADPLKFYTTVATVTGAQSRLDDIIDSAVRDAVSGNYLVDLVRGDDYVMTGDDDTPTDRKKLTRNQILKNVVSRAKKDIDEYGIELIDVKIKRLNYVEKVREKVYERMISERKKVAAEYRSEGEGQKAEILGKMDKELKKIRSEAFKTAEEIKGKADAKAAKIYAEAYNQDPEFYAFNRTLEALVNTIGDNTKMLISIKADIYKYLKSPLKLIKKN